MTRKVKGEEGLRERGVKQGADHAVGIEVGVPEALAQDQGGVAIVALGAWCCGRRIELGHRCGPL
jgi:hypothetical protein